MQKISSSNTNLAIACKILPRLINFILSGATTFAAYQAGYVVLPICLVANLSISFFLFITKSLFAGESPRLVSYYHVTNALTLITSALLQNSLLLLILSSITLIVAVTQRLKEPTITDPLTLITSFVFAMAINNLAFGHILSSVFSLVGIGKWAIVSIISGIDILAHTQQPTRTHTSVYPRKHNGKLLSASFSFSPANTSYTFQASFNAQPEAEEQCSIM